MSEMRYGLRIEMQGTQAALDELKQIEQAQKNLADSAKKSADSAQQSTHSITKTNQDAIRGITNQGAALQQANAAQQAHTQQVGLSERVWGGFLQTLSSAKNKFTDITSGLRSVNKEFERTELSAGQMKNAMRSVPAQFTDIATQLQGGANPLTVLMQQGGQLKDMFGSVGGAAKGLATYIVSLITPVTLLVAAIAALGVAAYQGSAESESLRNTLILTGNAAGVTASQIEGIARSVRASGLATQGAAAEVLNQVISSGNVAASNIDMVTTTVLRAKKIAGISTEEMVNNFNELGKSPVEASRKLNEQFNYLTGSVYEQIKALKEQGKDEEAAALAQKTYADAMNSRTNQIEANLGTLQKSWNYVADKAKKAWDAMLDIGREGELDDRIANAKKQLDTLKSGKISDGDGAISIGMNLGNSIANFFNSDRQKDYIAAQEAGLRKLESDKKQEEAKAKQSAQNKRDVANVETSDAYLKQRKSFTKSSALEDENRAYSKAIDAAAGNNKKLQEIESAHAAAIQKINEQFKEKGGGSVKSAIDKTVSAYESLKRAVTEKLEQSKVEVESAKEVTESQRLRIRAEQDLESGRIKASASQRTAIFNAIDEIEKNEKLRKEKEQALRIAKEQTEAAKQLTQHTDEYINSVTNSITQGQLELTLLTKTDEERKVAIELLKAEADYKKQIDKINQSKATDSVKKDEIAKITQAYQNLVVEIPVRIKAEDLIKSKKELDDFFDPSKAQDFGSALEGALNKSVSAVQKLTNTFSDYARTQEKIAKLKEKAEKFKGTDEVEYAKQMSRIQNYQAQEQIKNYANIAGAAKGFFAEGTRGYKALEAAENAFRIVQLASDFARGMSAAAVGIATQAQGDPYTAMPRMAMMAAAMASLGFAGFATGLFGSSGKGGETAAERQKVQGTGSVFGDAAAKSESITKSIDEMSKTSNKLLPINQGMLNALRNIESGITGVTNLVVRTNGGVSDGKAFNIKEGVLGTSKNALFDPAGLWGKTTQNIVDSGIQFGGNLTDLIAGKGFNQYASVDTTKSSWLGLKKTITNTQQSQALGSELSSQLGLIFNSMRSSMIEANKALGGTSQDIENTFNNMVLSTEKISLKGLKGEELNQAINAVISKSLDEMAIKAFPAYEKFRDMNEGYAQTVLRVANTYASVNQTLEQLKLKIFEVGDAGVDSAMKLTKLVGGMENLQSLSQSYYENFYSEEERFQQKRADLTKALSQVNITLPSSKEAYRAEVEKQRNAGNLEAVATLLKLNEAFKDVIDVAEANTQAANNRAAADRKAEIASRKAADAITAQAKAAEELAKQNLQKDYNDKFKERLRAGKTEELLNAKLMLDPINVANYMTKSGEFIAAGFNGAMAIHRAKESVKLIGEASQDAINVENVEGVIRNLRSNLFSDDFTRYLKSEVLETFKIKEQSNQEKSLSNLIGFMADKVRIDSFGNHYERGIAGLQSAQSRLSLATDKKVTEEYDIAMRGLKWSFEHGKISADEYNDSLKKADAIYKELKASPQEVARMQEQVQSAAHASVAHYFSKIGEQVAKMGEAAKAANEPIALATSAIGRFKSIAYVFGESSKAITLAKSELFNPSKDKSAFVSAFASIASKALTTADAARVAKDLESRSAFKNLGKESLRDISMLIDGVKQYDSTSFEKSFMRITDALARGTINYQQYSDLFEESLTMYRGENEAAKQFIDSMNNLSKAMLSFKNDLLIDKSKTTLDELTRMGVLSARFDEASKAAQNGNSEDISRFQDLSNRLLDKSNYETQAQYNEAFGRVMTEATRLEQYAAQNTVQNTNLRMEQELKGIRKEFKEELAEVQRLLAQGLSNIDNNTKKTVTELEIARAKV